MQSRSEDRTAAPDLEEILARFEKPHQLGLRARLTRLAAMVRDGEFVTHCRLLH